MPLGKKSSHTPKQRRQARHIEASEEARGVSPRKAASIAWATVNKQDARADGPTGRSSGKRPSKG